MNKLEVENKLNNNKMPERWEKVRLDNLGKTYTGLSGKNKEDFGEGKPYIPYMNIYLNRKIDLNKLEYVKIKRREKQNTIKYGDIFFTTSSETPDEVGIISVLLKKPSQDIYLNSFCFGFRLNNFNNLTPKFASFYLRGCGFRKSILKLAQGSTRYNLSKNNLLKIEISLPISLTEQQKIADILETVDETIEKTDAIIEKYKRIKQGLMQDLLTKGITAFEFEEDKLTQAVKKAFENGDHRFGREENLVSHLSRHLDEFFSGWDVDSEVEKNNERQRPDIIIHKRGTDKNLFAIEVKKKDNLNAIKEDIKKLEHVMLEDYQYEDAVFIGFDIDNFEDVFKLSEKVNFILVSKNGEIKVKSRVRRFKDSLLGRIPEDWDVVNIKDICKVRQGLQIAIANRFKETGPKRYIYITIQYLNSKEKDKDAEYIQNPPKSVLCGKNDLLMTRTGNTGKVIIDVEGVFHNNFFLVDYYKKQVDKIYLFYYLNLSWIQEKVKALAGTTTIPDLNHGDFYSLKFLKPPLPEQQRIASILSQIDETIEKEQNYKEKLESIKQGLMEDLLTAKVRVNHLSKEGVASV